MSVYPATKTMALFEASVAKDQGSEFRRFLGLVIPTMDDAYRVDDGGFRSHLGVSMIGDDCTRKLFYNWRWATKPNFDGRTLRLFNRGHLEEARFIALMLCSGMQVYQQDSNSKQFRISYAGGHFGSAIDGVVIGCPDVEPGTPLLCEMKTHSDKSFTGVKKQGVKEYKWEHYVQMQVYMRSMGLACGLYLAVNKNNDEIWAEIVPFDNVCADSYINRGITITDMRDPPEKLSESGAFYKCKWCEHSATCHRGAAPEINCRTCCNSVSKPNGTWHCVLQPDGLGILSKEAQQAGCEDYSLARYYKE